MRPLTVARTRKGGAAESYLPALHCIADGCASACARIALWQMTPLDDGRPTRAARKQWKNFILESGWTDNEIASELGPTPTETWPDNHLERGGGDR